MATEKSQCFVYEDMIRELNARKNGLLQEKGVLSRAQLRIAEIEDAVQLIDTEIAAYEVKAEPSREAARLRERKAAEEQFVADNPPTKTLVKSAKK